MSKIWRIIILIVGLLIIALGTIMWFKNPDSHLLPIVFAMLGLIVSFVPAIFPLPSPSATPSRRLRLSKLIVHVDRNFVGQVYLLDSRLYDRLLAKESHPNAQMQYISEQNVDRRSIYGAVFRNLIPEHQYTLWLGGSSPIHTSPVHVTLSAGESRHINLPFKEGVGH